MNMSQLFLDLPIWAMGLMTVGVIFFSFEGGFHLGRHRCRQSNKERDSLAGPMVGATLGLLAFMLSFSFGVAASHFDTRRHLVLDEANAIRATYDMADLLAAVPGAESKRLLREYVDIRTTKFVKSRKALKAMLARSNEIQKRLWDIAIASEVKSTGASSSWLYLQSLSDMINMQEKRILAGTRVSIPPVIWIILIGLAICGMAAMGYHAGLVGIRGFFVYQVLIVTFSLVLVLVYDLDRPRQGLFKVSQQAMFDVKQRIAGD